MSEMVTPPAPAAVAPAPAAAPSPGPRYTIDHAILILLALLAVLATYGTVELVAAQPDVKFLEGLGLLLAGALAGVSKPGGGG